MQVPPTIEGAPTFTGYKHPLKTLWRKGKLPSVKIGLYNEPLTADTVSLEHMKCISQGGRTVTGNLALANRYANSNRGTKDIRDFLTPKMGERYLEQFIGIKIKHKGKVIFDGNDYIRQVTATLKELGIKLNNVLLKRKK